MRSFVIFVILFSLVLFASAVQAQQEAPVHSLSLRVLVNGTQVMTPNLQVQPDTPAYVSYTADGDEKPTYSLQVIMLPHTEMAGKTGDAVKTVLWEGGVNQSKPVMDSITMLQDEAEKVGADPQSVKLIDEAGTSYAIQVVSHAVFMKDVSLFSKQDSKSCVASDGSLISSKNKKATNKAAGNVQPAASCCGGRCTGGGSMRCCGAVACCVCLWRLLSGTVAGKGSSLFATHA